MSIVTSIRGMMDAGLDLNGIENVGDSTNTGWTTQVPNYHTFNPHGGGSLQAFNAYSLFGDATTTIDPTTGQIVPDPQFPAQDGVNRNVSNNTVTFTGTINVGMKHYIHQLQAMRGSIDFGGSNPMGGPGVGYFGINPSIAGIPAVGPQQGNLYKTINLKISEMKGFKYHTSTNSIWNASSGQGATAEEVSVFGLTAIGSTVQI